MKFHSDEVSGGTWKVSFHSQGESRRERYSPCPLCFRQLCDLRAPSRLSELSTDRVRSLPSGESALYRHGRSDQIYVGDRQLKFRSRCPQPREPRGYSVVPQRY